MKRYNLKKIELFNWKTYGGKKLTIKPNYIPKPFYAEVLMDRFNLKNMLKKIVKLKTLAKKEFS